MPRNVKGKVAVITGGAAGIGFGITSCLLRNGIKTAIILDINEDEGNKSLAKLTKYADRVAFYKCDVTKDLEEVWAKLMNTYENIDILINNAGCAAENNPRKTLEVNTLAVMNWSLKFWEYARKDKNGKGGTVINIASIAAYRIGPFNPMYAASKFAVLGFTKSIGHSYNFNTSGVRVVAICPGFTKTSMTAMPVPWSINVDDYYNFLKTLQSQTTDDVGNAILEVFEKAQSGTAWEIEGGQPIIEV